MIKKGEPVLFADNSKGYLERCDAFERAAKDVGLIPIHYGGVGARVRESNLDKEIRDDFWRARAVVLYFGAPGEGSNYEDHWVLPEIRHCIATAIDCLIYVSDDFPHAILRKYGYALQPKVLSSRDDFGAVLRSDLEEIIGP